jgi:hypothetical protein
MYSAAIALDAIKRSEVPDLASFDTERLKLTAEEMRQQSKLAAEGAVMILMATHGYRFDEDSRTKSALLQAYFELPSDHRAWVLVGAEHEMSANQKRGEGYLSHKLIARIFGKADSDAAGIGKQIFRDKKMIKARVRRALGLKG